VRFLDQPTNPLVEGGTDLAEYASLYSFFKVWGVDHIACNRVRVR